MVTQILMHLGSCRWQQKTTASINKFEYVVLDSTSFFLEC